MKPVVQMLQVEAPIATVTVLEDRAQVQRQAQVQLTSGAWRIWVEPVAPVLSDKSLRAEFLGEAHQARLEDVRVQRRMLVRSTDQPTELQALETEFRTLLAQFHDTAEDRRHVERCFQQAETILRKTLKELPIDAAWGQVDPRTWREQLQSLFQQIRADRMEMLQSYQTQTSLRESLTRLHDRLAALSRPDQVFVARLEADLTIEAPGDYTIAFDYVVPNALWRPYHQAQLRSGPGSNDGHLHFRTDACVWQRTGEDWSNVELRFSTARSSLGTEPPLLTDDVLMVQEKSKRIVVEARDQTIQTAGLSEEVTPSTIELPGVEDGGEVRNLRSPLPATIVSDGRPYRVPLFTFEAPATMTYVVMPEVTPQVMLKSTHRNLAEFPILAGPVDLVRISGFVGRTSVLFIAPGEPFALGWGPEDTLRVQRTQTQTTEQDSLTRWKTTIIETRLFLSNLGAETSVINLIERVPVSEIEQVKVEVLPRKTTDGVQPDPNGFCTWNVTLQPYSQLQVDLVYQMATAPDVQGL